MMHLFLERPTGVEQPTKCPSDQSSLRLQRHSRPPPGLEAKVP